MEEQVKKAIGVIMTDTNVRILSMKDIGYTYGVIINTLCRDMKKDTQKVRGEMLIMLKDFTVNVNSELIKFCRIDDSSYEASISINNMMLRTAREIHRNFDNSDRMFTDLKVRCLVGDLKKVLELKQYIKLRK